jgi:two-component system cell cycle response regulator DivK
VRCKKRILVVEDNVGSRQLLALVLGRSGYDITEAATGLDAVEQARATHPDLIIMDLGLPGITGDEATARLKADASTRDIPVIVNTAFPKESSRVERAIAAGAALILYKPTSLKVFEEVARRYLSPDYMLTASLTGANPVASPIPSFRQFPQSF